MRTLVVEGERALATLLSRRLQGEGHQVEVASGNESGLSKVADPSFDLLILDLDPESGPDPGRAFSPSRRSDLNLDRSPNRDVDCDVERNVPGCDGGDLLRAARQSGDATPIMVLSGAAGIEERLKYFDLGADDCLAKPFALRELMVRLQRLIRRPRAVPEPVFRCADLELNSIRRSVARNGKTIELSAREYALIEYLMQHKGRCVPRAKLLEQVWEMPEKSGTNVVEVYVNYLRRKVDQGFGQPLIHTVRGQGYVLRENAAVLPSN